MTTQFQGSATWPLSFFPPNRGVDFYFEFLPAKSWSRFLFLISSRQIVVSISILNFFPPCSRSRYFEFLPAKSWLEKSRFDSTHQIFFHVATTTTKTQKQTHTSEGEMHDAPWTMDYGRRRLRPPPPLTSEISNSGRLRPSI
jgi:hypothetical protein